VITKTLIPISSKSWLLIFLLWLILGFYFILSSAVYFLDLQQSFNWENNLINRAPPYLLWGLLTPLVIYLGLKYRIEKPDIYPKIVRQFFIGICVAAVHRLLSVAISYSIFVYIGKIEESFIDVIVGEKFIVFSEWFDSFFIYWVLLAVIYSFEYYKSFNENRIKATQLEAKLAQAELDALKMQLQPHFLFNTLNAISVLVHKDPESADEMITRLSDLLRHTLDKFGQKKVRLKEEIEFIKSYLDIQKIRYKDRLFIDMNIAPGTIDIEVPALILQPLIENSIKHGVEPSTRPILISISSLLNKTHLLIEIKDNGLGLNGNANEGTGIKNIKARLEQMYGDSKLFIMSGLEGGGVKTTIQIPVE
jgi:two-component system LytT family sensor kinase